MKPTSDPRLFRVARWALGFGLLALSACGHDDMDMMSNHTAAFDAHASAYRIEIAGHHADVDGASGLAAISALEDQHRSRMEPHMAGMHHELGDMSGCMGPDGAPPESGEVLEDLDRLQSENDAHRAAMAGAVDIAAALAEEMRHRDRMTAILGDMGMHADAMMDGTGHFSCPHHAR